MPAKHEKSLAALPERFLLASLPFVEKDNAGQEGVNREVVCKPFGFKDVVLEGTSFLWDRFRFEISLERYESSLEQRTMWFVGKYAAEGTGEEWWDNNSGGNYRVEFMKLDLKDRREEEIIRRESTNANPYRRNLAFSAPRMFFSDLIFFKRLIAIYL